MRHITWGLSMLVVFRCTFTLDTSNSLNHFSILLRVTNFAFLSLGFRCLSNHLCHGMVKIRTVIPPNAKPGTSVIQVVNPKTNKPTRIRVPSNALPGQVIELELPEDPNRSISSSSNKLGSVPPPRSLKPEPGSTPSSSMSKSSPSISKGKDDENKHLETSVGHLPNPSSSVKIPAQLSIDKREQGLTIEKEPLVPRNTSENATTDNKSEPGCCYSCITFRFCGSLCA